MPDRAVLTYHSIDSSGSVLSVTPAALSGSQQVSCQLAIVSHGKPYGFWQYCRLRFRHGRCFAHRLSEKLTVWRFQARVLACPIVPLLLWLRTARAVLWKGSHVRQWLFASPLVFLFQMMWAAGELTGYLLGAGESCSRTD